MFHATVAINPVVRQPVCAGVLEQKAADPIGVLGVPRGNIELTEERRLLISEQASDRYLLEALHGRDRPAHLAGTQHVG